MNIQTYENPHEVATNAIEKSASDARIEAIAQEMYRDKRYTEEHKGLLYGATALLLLGNVWSAGTVVAFLGLTTIPTLSQYAGSAIAYGAGGLLIVGLAAASETMKVVSSRSAIRKGLRYKKVAGLSICIWLTLAGASAAASYYGATLIPQQVATPPAWNAAPYEEKEKALQAEIAAIRASASWKGTVTKTGNAQIAAVQKQQEALAAERAAARQEYEADKDDHKERICGLEYIAGGISIVVEMMILLCNFYIAYYFYQAYLEKKAAKAKQEEQEASDAIPAPYVKRINAPKAGGQPATTAPTAAPPDGSQERPRIGFIYGEATAEAPATAPAQEQDEKPKADHKNPHLRECLNCGKQYQYNARKQKYCSTECRLEHHKKIKGSDLRNAGRLLLEKYGSVEPEKKGA